MVSLEVRFGIACRGFAKGSNKSENAHNKKASLYSNNLKYRGTHCEYYKTHTLFSCGIGAGCL